MEKKKKRLEKGLSALINTDIDDLDLKQESSRQNLIPINEINFDLHDLKSRSKNCLFAKIDKPDDELMFALILKNFSDRQIEIDKKFINFIIKRIDRSYGKISDFIYKIDELSLKNKKQIDFKTIKEIL